MFFESKHSLSDDEFVILNSDRMSFPIHIHRSFEYFKQHSGATEILIENQKYLLQSGESVLVFPLQPHSYTCVEAGNTVKLGVFSIEFIHVNHSIADACALAIGTPVGTVIHSGDMKIDVTPIDGDMINLTRFGELGKKGVLLFMCESTNAERQGSSPSEKTVGRSLEYIFSVNTDKRIIIATFSSNVHRVQQIINASAAHSRKVAITGRSMQSIISAAVRLGYMNVPEGVLIDINEIKRFKPEELTIITTGSQGEAMSALSRMASKSHRKVEIGYNVGTRCCYLLPCLDCYIKRLVVSCNDAWIRFGVSETVDNTRIVLGQFGFPTIYYISIGKVVQTGRFYFSPLMFVGYSSHGNA